MSLAAGFKAGFEAAEAAEIATKQKNVRMRENFRGKPRRLKLEQMHMNVHIFKTGFTFIERAVATLRFTWASVPFC